MHQRAALTDISTIPFLILGMILFAGSGKASAIAPNEVSGELDVIIKEDFDRNRFENDYFYPTITESTGISFSLTESLRAT